MSATFDVPVVLFVFNRPELTRQTFAEIRRLRPKTLLIVADGPRAGHPQDAALCADTRRVVADIDWPCEVQRNYAERNLGCGQRISSGIDWAFSLFPEAIFLEDDCVPHPQFFAYCRALLDRYRDDDTVFCVSGFFQPLAALSANPDRHYLSLFFEMWGWAGWRRAWKAYDFKMRDWEQLRTTNWLADAIGDRRIARHLAQDFDNVYYHNGDPRIVDTWDHQFAFAMLRQGARCAKPTQNLVRNVGVGIVEATHTKLALRRGRVALTTAPLPQNCSIPISVPPELDRAVFRRYCLRSQTFLWIKQQIKRFPGLARLLIGLQLASYRRYDAIRRAATDAGLSPSLLSVSRTEGDRDVGPTPIVEQDNREKPVRAPASRL